LRFPDRPACRPDQAEAAVIEDLVLPARLRRAIESAARDAHPRECCGLIEGTREGARAIATVLHPVRNAAEAADGFVWLIAALPAHARNACELRAFAAQGGAFRGLRLVEPALA